MHVCMAVMIGWPMVRLSRHVAARIAWGLYPLWITFVVIATGNHYLTDVVMAERKLAAAQATREVAKQALAKVRRQLDSDHDTRGAAVAYGILIDKAGVLEREARTHIKEGDVGLEEAQARLIAASPHAAHGARPGRREPTFPPTHPRMPAR
jgi:hypothetical protein